MEEVTCNEMEARSVRLCSALDDLTRVTCDLPKNHRGPHSARVIFGDEYLYEGVDD